MRPTAVLSALNFCKDKFNLFNNDVVAWEYAKKCIQVHVDSYKLETDRGAAGAVVRSVYCQRTP